MDIEIVVLVILLIYYGLGIALFARFSKEDILQKRQPVAVLVMSFAAALGGFQCLSTVMNFYLNHFWMSCSGFLVIAYVSAPTWMVCCFLRCSHVLSIAMQQRQQLYKVASASVAKLTLQQLQPPTYPQTATQTKSGRWRSFQLKIVRMSQWMLFRTMSFMRKSEVFFYRLMGKSGPAKEAKADEFRINKASILIAIVWCLLFHGLVIIILVIVDSYASPMLEWHGVCGCNPHDYFLLYIDAVLFLSLTPFFFYSLDKVKDSLYLRIELSWSLFLFFASFFLHLYIYWVSIASPDSLVSSVAPLFPIFVASILTFFLTVYFPLFILLVRKCQHHEVLMCTARDLEHAIVTPHLCNKLKEIAARQMNIENIEFLQDFHEAKVKNSNPEESKPLLMAMYEKYIKDEAPMELNVPYQIRRDIDAAIKQNTLKLESFDEVGKMMMLLVLTNTFYILVEEMKET